MENNKLNTIKTMEINDVVQAVNKNSREKGFWADYEFIIDVLPLGKQRDAARQAFMSQKLMLIVSELSEALEALRKDHFANHKDFSLDMFDVKDGDDEAFKAAFEKNLKNSFEDELADALIRICDLAGKMNIDIDWFVNRKMQYNGARPYMHGKNF